MPRYVLVVVATILVTRSVVKGLPITLTIDCSSMPLSPLPRSKLPELKTSDLDVKSICNFIHRAIPKAVQDGRFIDDDQQGFNNNQIEYAVPPPRAVIPKFGFPKWRPPKVAVPKFKVPKLKSFKGPAAPRLGSTSTSIMTIPSFRETVAQESSAERMEKFKKGVQKMLHVVKVLGQIDQYISERTRIIVDKLSKTFAD